MEQLLAILTMALYLLGLHGAALPLWLYLLWLYLLWLYLLGLHGAALPLPEERDEAAAADGALLLGARRHMAS